MIAGYVLIGPVVQRVVTCSRTFCYDRRLRLDRACGTESGNLFSNTTHSAMIAGYVLIGPVVQRVVTCSPTFCYDRRLHLDRACGTESGNLFSNILL